MTEGLAGVAKKFGICCRPLADARKPAELDHRAQELFPAASVIKVGIMAALLNDVRKGRYRLDHEVQITEEQMVKGAGVLYELQPRPYSLAELCTMMMVVSDNTASNACLRQVGMERLNQFFQKRGYEAKVQRYFMHPVVDGRDNQMTAESATLMLADLYDGTLTPELRDFAIGCLRRQQYREKIPLMLPIDLPVGHKTGELDGVRHDAAVVELDSPYILTLFTAEGAEPWLVDREMALYSHGVYQLKMAETVTT